MSSKKLSHFLEVCLFCFEGKKAGFANRVLRISFFRKYMEAWQGCGAFFLTHPLSFAEALVQVNFLLHQLVGRTIEQWAAGIGALFFETGKYRQTGGTESRNRKILTIE
jgi:hypothetical protein